MTGKHNSKKTTLKFEFQKYYLFIDFSYINRNHLTIQFCCSSLPPAVCKDQEQTHLLMPHEAFYPHELSSNEEISNLFLYFDLRLQFHMCI